MSTQPRSSSLSAKAYRIASILAAAALLAGCGPGPGGGSAQTGGGDAGGDPAGAAIHIDPFFLGGWRSVPATEAEMANALNFRFGDALVETGGGDSLEASYADAYEVRATGGNFTRTAGIATSILFTASPSGATTVLYRDADKAKTSGFAFSLLEHKAASRLEGRALGLGGSAHVSLVLQNVLDASEKLEIIQAPTGASPVVEIGKFRPGDSYAVLDAVTREELGVVAPEKDGTNIGSLVVTSLPYNFKLSLAIEGYYRATNRGATAAASSEDFLLRGEDYAAKLVVANTGGSLTSSPGISFGNGIALVEVPAGLTISGLAQNQGLTRIAGGSSYTVDASVTVRADPSDADFGQKDYIDYNPKLRLVDDDGNVWEDSVPIRIWKDKMNVEVVCRPVGVVTVESEDRGSCVLISPEGRSIVIPSGFSGPLPRRRAGYLACPRGSLTNPARVVEYLVATDADGTGGLGWVSGAQNDVHGAGNQVADDLEASAVLLPAGVYYSGTVRTSDDAVDYLRIGVAPEPAPRVLTDVGPGASPPVGTVVADPTVSVKAATKTSGDELFRGSTSLHYTYNRTRIEGAVAKGRGSSWGLLYAVRSVDRNDLLQGYPTDFFFATQAGAIYRFDLRATNGYRYTTGYLVAGAEITAAYEPFRAATLISDYAGGEQVVSGFDMTLDSMGNPHVAAAICPKGGDSLAVNYLRRSSTAWSAAAKIAPGGYARPGRDPRIAIDESADQRLLATWMEGSRPMYAISEDGGATWEGGSILPVGAASPATPSFESGRPYLYCGGRKIEVGAAR